MASNIYTYFFKKENSNLTVEELQKMGILAREADNGFVEVAPNDKKLYTINKKVSEKDLKDHEEHFFSTVLGGLKPNTPPLMVLDSSTFGGCFDDEPYIATINPETFKTTKHKPEDIFEKHYGTRDYFDTVGFSRSTKDLISESQIEELVDFVTEQENKDYQEWISNIEDKSEAALLKMFLELTDKVHGNTWRYDYREKTEAEKNYGNVVKYLRMHLGMPYDSDAERLRY